jgi:polysaccharide export outer membrane protein
MMRFFREKRLLLFVMLLGISLGRFGDSCKADQADGKKTEGAKANPPRELAMQPLPVYRINPPDVIEIEMLKMVPPQPYHVAVYDVLQIRASFALPDQPINDFFLVNPSGEVDLGPAYGSVKVLGMTIDESQKVINTKLAEKLRQPEVSVQLSKTEGTQPVTGQYLVASDGRINLRQYGTVLIKGMTIEEARQAIEKHLAKYFVSPEVSVDIHGYNSQVYYVVTDGAGMGDNVKRLPITGNETVLDAIAAIGGLSQMSGKKMWIARPSAGNVEKGTVLPIDYAAITQGGATATNYQIMPGDRIFIEGDPIIALNNNLSKKTAPIERTLGLLGLEASTFGAKRNHGQAPEGETAKQLSKQNAKADKIEADLTDALYDRLEELISMLKN